MQTTKKRLPIIAFKAIVILAAILCMPKMARADTFQQFTLPLDSVTGSTTEALSAATGLGNIEPNMNVEGSNLGYSGLYEWGLGMSPQTNTVSVPCAGESNYPLDNMLPINTIMATPQSFSCNDAGTGDFWFAFGYNGVTYWTHYNYTGGVWNYSLAPETTQIITAQPSGTVSTTTTTALTGFIADTDLSSTTVITFSARPNYCSTALLSVLQTTQCGSYNIGYTWQATTSGNFGVATTTTYPLAGVWYWNANIETPDHCLFGICLGDNTLTATSGEFIIGQPSGFDLISENATNALNDVFSTTSVAALDQYCNPLTFSASECVQSLIIPSTSDINNVFMAAQNGFFSDIPFGYVKRAYDIMSGAATSSLPTITIQLPSPLPFSSDVITFDLNDMVNGGAAFLNSASDPNSGLDFQQMVEPWWQTFLAVWVLFLIIEDILKPHHAGESNRKPK